MWRWCRWIGNAERKKGKNKREKAREGKGEKWLAKAGVLKYKQNIKSLRDSKDIDAGCPNWPQSSHC